MRRSRLIRSYAASLAALLLPDAVAGTPALPERSSSEEMVTGTVTPHELAGKSWEFEIGLNTWRPLADDLLTTEAHVDAQGKRHAPLAWRGDGPGEHYRKGVLLFAPLQPRPASLELQIQHAVEKAPRSFKWQMP